MVAVAMLIIRFVPNIYHRFFGGGNIAWISERLEETLKEKNELVVLEATVTGSETAIQNAWLIGAVQEVFIPYAYTVTFTVDLSHSHVSVLADTIEIRLPPPVAHYSKLVVNESEVKRVDWLYRLTPERYAAIKEEIEEKLFNELSIKQEYLDAAWNATLKSIEGLFQSIAEQSEMGVTCNIQVICDPSVVYDIPPTQESPAIELLPVARII